jgi:hypothetical protein
MIIYFFSVIMLLLSNSLESTQADIKKSKGGIGATLTPMNALFPRDIYVKDKHGNEIKKKSVARTLLIFLDDDEDDTQFIGAITDDAMVALRQKPCPLLISGTLLHNIFSNNARNNASEARNKEMQSFVDEIVKQFDPQDWIIKIPLQFNDWEYALVLLIPKIYIIEKAKEQGFKAAIFNDLIKEKDFDLDKVLGLRITNMHSIDDSQEAWHKRFNRALDLIPTEDAFGELITNSDNNPFVPYKQYLDQAIGKKVETLTNIKQEEERSLLPQWNILITGHGGASAKVLGGISNETFKEFLNFLNTKITTKIFIYISCYASGSNRIEVYNEASKNVNAIYPFPIIAVGIGEVQISASSFTKSYREFARLAEKADSYPTYIELLRTLMYDFDLFMREKMEVRLVQKKGISLENVISNFSLIRFPNRTTFVPLMPMLDITPLMADTRDINKPLDVRNFIQTNIDPQMALQPHGISRNRDFFVLLSAQYIPFDVILTLYSKSGAKNRFFIISTLVGETYRTSIHVFDNKIISDATNLNDFFSMFYHVTYAKDKIFYIKKLETPIQKYFDVIIHISAKPKTINVFYSWKNILENQRMEMTYESFTDLGKRNIEQSYTFDRYENGITEIQSYLDAASAIRDDYQARHKEILQQSKVIETGFKKATHSLDTNPLIDLSNSLLLLAQK